MRHNLAVAVRFGLHALDGYRTGAQTFVAMTLSCPGRNTRTFGLLGCCLAICVTGLVAAPAEKQPAEKKPARSETEAERIERQIQANLRRAREKRRRNANTRQGPSLDLSIGAAGGRSIQYARRSDVIFSGLGSYVHAARQNDISKYAPYVYAERKGRRGPSWSRLVRLAGEVFHWKFLSAGAFLRYEHMVASSVHQYDSDGAFTTSTYLATADDATVLYESYRVRARRRSYHRTVQGVMLTAYWFTTPTLKPYARIKLGSAFGSSSDFRAFAVGLRRFVTYRLFVHTTLEYSYHGYPQSPYYDTSLFIKSRQAGAHFGIGMQF